MDLNPFAKVRIGAVGKATTVVTRELTVRHFHAEMPEAYGTPFMIYLMEVAASNAVHTDLPAGWASVGVDVNIRHLAATPLGCTVVAQATVTGIDERLIHFAVEARDETTLIGQGTHTRAPIDLARFERRLASHHR
jgi:predicted thioesterase